MKAVLIARSCTEVETLTEKFYYENHSIWYAKISQKNSQVKLCQKKEIKQRRLFISS